MKNLNEPRKDVVSIDEHRSKMEGGPSLVPKGDLEGLRARWNAVQASFVDDPQRAVKEADELVSSALDDIVEGFRAQRSQLEKQWAAGAEASTEDLRLSLQRYRTFFDRLLSI